MTVPFQADVSKSRPAFVNAFCKFLYILKCFQGCWRCQATRRKAAGGNCEQLCTISTCNTRAKQTSKKCGFCTRTINKINPLYEVPKRFFRQNVHHEGWPSISPWETDTVCFDDHEGFVMTPEITEWSHMYLVYFLTNLVAYILNNSGLIRAL